MSLVVASADNHTLWEVALGMGVVVIAVVIVLMMLLLSFVGDIERGAGRLLDEAGAIAGNSRHLAELGTTGRVVGDILAEAVKHLGFLQRVTSGAPAPAPAPVAAGVGAPLQAAVQTAPEPAGGRIVWGAGPVGNTPRFAPAAAPAAPARPAAAPAPSGGGLVWGTGAASAPAPARPAPAPAASRPASQDPNRIVWGNPN